MSHQEQVAERVRRWTIYVCEGCGWKSAEYDDDPPCPCDRDEWDETPPEIREIEAIARPDLLSSLNGLVEKLDGLNEDWREKWRTRADSYSDGAADAFDLAASDLRNLIETLGGE